MTVAPNRAEPRRRERALDRRNARAGLRLRELDASPDGLARLARFYRDAYTREFPDPDERESLLNMRRYLSAKACGWYGRNAYHVVVAEIDGSPVGGVICDYLARPNAGVIEFLFVAAAARGCGCGRALLDEAIRLLRSDARASGQAPLLAVVAEMNDPFRRPATRDNLDPFERAIVWGRWGFAALGMRYVQPALSRGQRPVENLMLIARMMARPRAKRVPASWALDVIGEYMRWAMRIAAPGRNQQFRAMRAALDSCATIELTPLQAWVGRDPLRPLQIDEITGAGRALRETLTLLGRAIPVAGRVASTREFRDSLALPATRVRRYRLWSLRSPGAARVEGMASFFALAPCGFGGYVVLDGALRGRGMLRQLVARIEERMMRDSATAEGWFVECGDESLAPFLRVGFARVGGDYRPPPVGTRARAACGPERLHLLHKPFGASPAPAGPSRSHVLDGVAAILRHVYRVASPRRHACYRRLAASLESAC